jgi:FixJ family two-component response regulator
LSPETTAALKRLTPAQARVLGSILIGDSAEESAKRFGLSIHTIVNHRRKITEAFFDEPVRKTIARFVHVPAALRLRE